MSVCGGVTFEINNDLPERGMIEMMSGSENLQGAGGLGVGVEAALD